MSNTKITVDFSTLSTVESRIVKKLAVKSDKDSSNKIGVPPFVWNNGTTLNVEFRDALIVQARTDQHADVNGVMVNGSWETLLGSVKRSATLRTDDIPAPVLEHVHTVHVKDATEMLNVLHTATVIARNDKHRPILQCVWLQGSKGSNKLTVGSSDRFNATHREIDVEPLEADVHALISNSTLSGLLTKRRADAGSFDMDVVTDGRNNYVRFHCAPHILFYALGSDHEPPAVQRLFHRVAESNITITANVKDVVKALDIASRGAAKCDDPAIMIEFDRKQNVMWFHGLDKDDTVAAVNAVVDVHGERYRSISLNRKYFMDALKGVARGSKTVVLSMLTPVKPVIICSAETVDDPFPFGTIICPMRGDVGCTNDWTPEYAESATMIGSRDDVNAKRETVKPIKKRKTVKRETVKVEPSTDVKPVATVNPDDMIKTIVIDPSAMVKREPSREVVETVVAEVVETVATDPMPTDEIPAVEAKRIAVRHVVESGLSVKQIPVLNGLKTVYVRDAKGRKIGYVGSDGTRCVVVVRQWYEAAKDKDVERHIKTLVEERGFTVAS